MALSSMTGFARDDGASGSYRFSWELKSVNAKGLDLRLRIPPGWDAVEAAARVRLGDIVTRGTIFANLAIDRQGVAPTVKINETVLTAVLDTLKSLRGRIDAQPPHLDGILNIRGVVDVIEANEDEAEHRNAEAAAVASFDRALKNLAGARRQEGDALARVLGARLETLAALAARAEAAPGRQPEAIRRRLADQVATLLASSDRFDADRLHQEAILLAAKADIREELDRLGAHVAQARRLLQEGGPVGRRLDFLSQELNREANTICAKSNDGELTTIGLELKAVIEQFREQVQNLE
jgi:uncharacterized protein (TIGR00255 family)